MADNATKIPHAKSYPGTHPNPHQHKLHESIGDSHRTEYHAGRNAQARSRLSTDNETDRG